MLFGAHKHHNPVSILIPRNTSGTRTHQRAPALQNRKPCRQKHGFLSLSRVQGGSICAGCKGKPLAVREAEGRLAQQMLAFAERSLGKLCFSRPRSPEAERSGPRHFAGFRRKTESVIVGNYTFAESAVPPSPRAPNETHHTHERKEVLPWQETMAWIAPLSATSPEPKAISPTLKPTMSVRKPTTGTRILSPNAVI